jgi:hypothetical protein
MGRWAQRKRTGGGAPVLNYIIEATNFGGETAGAEYAYKVDANALSPAAFTSNPSGEIANTILQFDPRRIIIEFDIPQDADTTLVYSGTTPGIVTPQTIAYV